MLNQFSQHYQQQHLMYLCKRLYMRYQFVLTQFNQHPQQQHLLYLCQLLDMRYQLQHSYSTMSRIQKCLKTRWTKP